MSLKAMFFQKQLVTIRCALVRLTLERKPEGWGRTCGAAFHERTLISVPNYLNFTSDKGFHCL